MLRYNKQNSIFRMIPELKAFFDSPLTKSLNCSILSDDPMHKVIRYELTNGAMDMQILVSSSMGQDDRNAMQVFTKVSAKTLEIRPDGNTTYTLHCQIHQLKDIKEVLNVLKNKFFPFI